MAAYVTYSRNLTLVLTRACAIRCLYCGFREDGAPLFSDNELRRIIEKAKRDGASEILIMSGEQPGSLPQVKEGLDDLGLKDFVDLACEVCERLLREGLLPHSNLGCLTYEELERLGRVNSSMGLMLENINRQFGRLVHPGKDIDARLRTIEDAGRLKIPFTTGILMGLGESQADRLSSLKAIGELEDRYGHIQEVILQPYVPNRGSTIVPIPPAYDELRELVTFMRTHFPRVAIQIPPNLTPLWPQLIECGANDLGGISSEPDVINPGSPWSAEEQYDEVLKARGYELRRRLPIYPRHYRQGWYSAGVGQALFRWTCTPEFRYYDI